MGQTGLPSPDSFCRNPECPDHGKVNHGNIRKFGRTRKGTQRYQCKSCKKTFVETTGTLFYGRHHSQATILECLAWLGERNSLAAIRRVKGIKEDTLLDWLREAAKHPEQTEALLLDNYGLTSAQLEVLWAYGEHTPDRRG